MGTIHPPSHVMWVQYIHDDSTYIIWQKMDIIHPLSHIILHVVGTGHLLWCNKYYLTKLTRYKLGTSHLLLLQTWHKVGTWHHYFTNLYDYSLLVY